MRKLVMFALVGLVLSAVTAKGDDDPLNARSFLNNQFGNTSCNLIIQHSIHYDPHHCTICVRVPNGHGGWMIAATVTGVQLYKGAKDQYQNQLWYYDSGTMNGNDHDIFLFDLNPGTFRVIIEGVYAEDGTLLQNGSGGDTGSQNWAGPPAPGIIVTVDIPNLIVTDPQ